MKRALSLTSLLFAACVSAPEPAQAPSPPSEIVTPPARPGAAHTPGMAPPVPVVLPDPATLTACANRRARTAAALGNGLLVLAAGEEGHGRFRTQNDFQWLVGAGSPGAVLVLAATDGLPKVTRLYLHPKDARWELWNGPRLAPDAATRERTGIEDLRELDRLTADLAELLDGTSQVYAHGLELAASARAQDPADLLQPLQVVKEPGELEALRAAIRITEGALADAMRHALPGTHEFEAEARIEGGFRLRGAEGLAFASICGSGPNGCYLHYRANDRRIEDGELLLMDVGAKFRHYCADVTRTIPVNGRFTERQREVYTHVYDASRAAARALKPGASLREAHQVAAAHLDRAGYGRYFAHSVGHGLGLLVHDAPAFGDKLEAGMVVTIEPGIYIAEESLGVRIEDDYLITENGAELLSSGIPAQPDELEAFLAALRAGKGAPRNIHSP